MGNLANRTPPPRKGIKVRYHQTEEFKTLMEEENQSKTLSKNYRLYLGRLVGIDCMADCFNRPTLGVDDYGHLCTFHPFRNVNEYFSSGFLQEKNPCCVHWGAPFV